MFSACIDFDPLPPRRGVRLWLVALFHKVFAVTGANPANNFAIEWSIGGGWSTMSALGWWRPYRFCLISRLPSFRLVVVLEERHSCRVFSLMAEGRTLSTFRYTSFSHIFSEFTYQVSFGCIFCCQVSSMVLGFLSVSSHANYVALLTRCLDEAWHRDGRTCSWLVLEKL